MAQILWMPRAVEDLQAVDLRYRLIRTELAERIVGTIRQATLRLVNHPLSVPIVPSLGARKLTVISYPYLIFYRYDGDVVRILRVRHQSENWRPR